MSSDHLSPVPMALTLLICDGAHRCPATGKWTLLGLFNSIQAMQFPTEHGQMVAYLALTDANGRVPIRFQIVDDEGDENPLFQIDAELVTNDPRTVAEVVIPIFGTAFPQAGDYRLQVFACQQFLIERRISVLDASHHNDA